MYKPNSNEVMTNVILQWHFVMTFHKSFQMSCNNLLRCSKKCPNLTNNVTIVTIVVELL